MSFIIEKANPSNMYQTILDLEGPRCPLHNLKALNACADYIVEQMTSYGLAVTEHVFNVKGFDHPLRNIVASIGNPFNKALLIGSHYDTVEKAPGANDNLSAVAVSLEMARILSKIDNPPAVKFVFFSVEEGHPGYKKALNEAMDKSGLLDEKRRHKNLDMMEFSKKVSKAYKARPSHEPPWSIYDDFLKTWELNDDEKLYLTIRKEQTQLFSEAFPAGKSSYTIGSFEYCKKYKGEIKEAIVLDCLGWFRHDDNTQKPLPINDTMKSFLSWNGIEAETSKGNYLAVMGDIHSHELLSKVESSLKKEAHNMPHLAFQLPLDYAGIKSHFPDGLRSDHGPFWKEHIPSLFITDMANFRSELYHTPADTYEHVDYGKLATLTDGLVSYVME